MTDKWTIAAVDVAYSDDIATVACVGFNSWQDAEPGVETVLSMPTAAPYQAGNFYKRELPCILAILDELPALPSYLLIDGYVWLDGGTKPGLGAYLWRALGEDLVVVGVAKNPYWPLPPCTQVLRGKSETPLYVTAAGSQHEKAALWVQGMHGEYRMPTLLRRVDQLSRGIVPQ